MKSVSITALFAILAILTFCSGPCLAQPTSIPLSDFDPARDKNKFAQLFRPYGVRPDRAATVSAEGVSFQLGSKKDPGHVGVKAKGPLSGDFYIEVKYELSPTSPVDDGYGIMVGLGVSVGLKVGSASISRGVYKSDGSQYSAGRSIPRSKGVHYATAHFPTSARSGRLAIRRVRDEIVTFASDTPTGELMELQRYPFSNQPVQDVSLYADTGGASSELKCRLYDLKVSTGAKVELGTVKPGPVGKTIVPLPEPETETAPQLLQDVSDIPQGPGTAPTPLRGSWWIPVLTFVVGLVIGVSIGRGLSRTSSSSSSATPKAGSPSDKPKIKKIPQSEQS